MFSFGGFSTILPYIGYLSVIWVCILIGASGQLNKVFGIIVNPAHSIENTVTGEKEILNTVLYVKILKNNTVKSTELFAAYLYFQFRTQITKFLIYYDDTNHNWIETHTTSCGLRAPPQMV